MGLKSDDAYTAELQTILRIAHALRDATGVSQLNRFNVVDHLLTAIDSINLPSPQPLLPSLIEAGLSHEIAFSISEAYQMRAEDLRQRIRQCVVTACHDIAEFPVAAIASSPEAFIGRLSTIFTEVYIRRLEQWKRDIIRRVKQAPTVSPKAIPVNPRTFNQEFVPLLEHFFEENPFPTHADKMFLAKKSNMEYKQIHVWFQNRRNRTKKDGRPLRKRPTEPVPKSVDKPYARTKPVARKDCLVDSDSQPSYPLLPTSSLGKTETELRWDHASEDVLALSSPPHAFPSTYPPRCHYDPFPCKSGPVNFSVPQWRRLPTSEPLLSDAICMDDLVDKFALLNVRGETHLKGSPKLYSHAATAAITVIPSPAPHPSLIVHENTQPTNVLRVYPTVRAPVSHFQYSGSTSRPVTLVPLSIPPSKNDPPRKRKTAPLPRHFSSRRNPQRETTPSDSSSTSTSSPPLFSTDFECHGYSSSVSSLSTPSDIGNIQELPHSIGSPCRSPLDSSIHSPGRGGDTNSLS